MIPLRRLFSPQVIRWGILGFLFAGLGLGLLKLMAGVLAWPYAIATLCSGEICTILRFLAVDRWVFQHERPTFTRLWQYHVANLLSFAIWWSAANGLKIAGVHYLLAAVLAMFFSVGFSLGSNFLWIWRKPAARSEPSPASLPPRADARVAPTARATRLQPETKAPERGIFAPLFEDPHRYLALLNLHTADAPAAVAGVRDCCQRAPDPFPDICRLLAEENWRPHLVAVVAVVIRGHQEEAVRLLWRRIDIGSWVTPQIGVALARVDPEFLPRARARLEARCPVDRSDLWRRTAAARHSAAVPAGAVAPDGKAAQTLLYLVRQRLPQAEWLDALVAAPDFQAVLRDDIDRSDEIAEGWSQRIQAIVSAEGFAAPKG